MGPSSIKQPHATHWHIHTGLKLCNCIHLVFNYGKIPECRQCLYHEAWGADRFLSSEKPCLTAKFRCSPPGCGREIQNDANRCPLWVTSGSPVARHSMHQKVTQDTNSGLLQKAGYPCCHRTDPTLDCSLSKNCSKRSAAKYSQSEEDENRAGNLYNGSWRNQRSTFALCNYKYNSTFLEREEKKSCSGYFYITLLLYYVIFRLPTTWMELLCTR